MAAASNESNEGRSSSIGGWSDGAKEEKYKRCSLLWDAGIRKNIGKKFFNVIQFILNDEDEEYGSDWQKLVCSELMVPIEDCERFWNECGKKTARVTISRRRQNTTRAMKDQFVGTWDGGVCLGLYAGLPLMYNNEINNYVVADLYKEDPQQLPDPEILLGGIIGRDKDEWPEYGDADRPRWLREVPDYQKLLVNFSKEVLLNNEFRMGAHNKFLFEYMDATLEAFLVLAYVNNHDVWRVSAMMQMEYGSDSDRSSSVSDLSDGVVEARYTNRGGARGKGKFGGWSQEGIEVYNKIVDILVEQRKDRTTPIVKDFEWNLMREWSRRRRGDSREQETVRRVRARNSVASALRRSAGGASAGNPSVGNQTAV